MPTVITQNTLDWRKIVSVRGPKKFFLLAYDVPSDEARGWDKKLYCVCWDRIWGKYVALRFRDKVRQEMLGYWTDTQDLGHFDSQARARGACNDHWRNAKDWD